MEGLMFSCFGHDRPEQAPTLRKSDRVSQKKFDE
jgi:hypothetical protein